MPHFISFFKSIGQGIKKHTHNVKLFSEFFAFYLRKKVTKTFVFFEEKKDVLVKFLLMKRGRYNRPFLHIATMGVLGLGILITPFIADTYPIFASNGKTIDRLPSPNKEEQPLTADTNVFQTNVSAKLRTSVIDYTVERGDTLSTIAEKFSQPGNPISVDTIKWANDMNDEDVTVGDVLKIPPVKGIVYKVQSGDTVYTIAKKFNTNPQKIVDYPYNDFANPETFSLVTGQMLMVPDGVMPSQQPVQTYYAQVPAQSDQIPSIGGFIWPLGGEITQYFSFYHTGIDIAGPIGTPIYAAKSGVIVEASCGWNYGYGCHVYMDNGGSFSTMYAHMAGQPVVGVGQSVAQGQLIGYRGNTGRSTGPHTHFEIRVGGHVVNPMAYLK
jgi:murein DD-endopeptidase MepM/ murein hydrolase activator NlpD